MAPCLSLKVRPGPLWKTSTDELTSSTHSGKIINLLNFLPKKITNEKLKISLQVQESQFIEPQTVVGKISLLPEQSACGLLCNVSTACDTLSCG